MPNQHSADTSEETEAGAEAEAKSDSDEVAGWLAQFKAEEERKRERERLSKAKTVRFRADDAEHISRKADELGVSDAEYIRLMCSGRRPDVVVARRKVERLHSLIERFAGAFSEEGESDDIDRLRHVAEEMQRQADKIAGE